MTTKAVLSVVVQQSPTAVPPAVRTHSRHTAGLSSNPSAIRTIRLYLTTLSPDALEAEATHDELAMRAKIILEFMALHAIADVNHGIRAFTAFERDRLHRLGLVLPKMRQAAHIG